MAAEKRMYRVLFEKWGATSTSSEARWLSNYTSLNVVVVGGAGLAVEVATKRAQKQFGRVRAYEVTLIGAES